MCVIGNIAGIIPEEFTQENLPTGILRLEGRLRLCDQIHASYPVTESIVASTHTVDQDSVALIVSIEGRPGSFQTGSGWSCYDIVSVLVEGRTYQCFRSSLKILT